MKNTRYSFSLIASLVTFVAVVIMFALGVWQLHRAQEKIERIESVQDARSERTANLQDVLNSAGTEASDMAISFKGKADSSKYFLIDNRVHKGRVGYDVLVPVHTKYGWLLANFGWVAALNSRSVLPEVLIENETLEYSGVISFPNKNILVKETAKIDGKWAKVLQQVNVEVMQQHFQESFFRFIVLLNSDPESGYVRNWQPVVMPPAKHIAYAVQWFLLAIAAIVIFIMAQRRKQKRNGYECKNE